MKWITCAECEEEFRVISENIEPPAYCPFCGVELEDDQDEEYDEE